jgi:ribosomal protein S18 acetylase RimI-like enzyme
VDIRAYRPSDEERVVALSLRAWAPVFASVEEALGGELSARLHGDWREHQAAAVRATLADARVWVADPVVGFVAASVLDRARLLGEISMLAVDPDHQRLGIGKALTEVAVAWLRESGMRVVMVETGGDPGHVAARELYESAGFTSLPVARYFQAL